MTRDGQNEGHVDQHGRTPPEALEQGARHDLADGAAGRGEPDPDGDRLAQLVRREDRGDQRQGRRHDEGGADALDAAADDRPRRRWSPGRRRPTRRRRPASPPIRASRATEAVADRRGRQQQAGEHQHVGVKDPLDRAGAGAEVLLQRRCGDVQRRHRHDDDDEAQAQHAEEEPSPGMHLGLLMQRDRTLRRGWSGTFIGLLLDRRSRNWIIGRVPDQCTSLVVMGNMPARPDAEGPAPTSGFGRHGTTRDRAAINRERIVEAAVALLDRDGADGPDDAPPGRAAGYRVRPRCTGTSRRRTTCWTLPTTRSSARSPCRTEPSAEWRDDVLQLAMEWRATILRHPWTATLLGRPLLGPNMLARLEFLQQTLHRAGLEGDGLQAATWALVSQVMGAAAAEVTFVMRPEDRQAANEHVRANHERYPMLAAADYGGESDWTANFVQGVQLPDRRSRDTRAAARLPRRRGG